MSSPGLFDIDPLLPDGLRYQAELITRGEEEALAARLAELPFKPFEFHGYLGKRRTVSFGWRYDFQDVGFYKSDDIPDFLQPLRQRAAAFASLAPGALEHALVTEYAPGAGIGWHRDKAVFDKVVGISLLAPCTFRLRRRKGSGWVRAAFEAEARSAYLLDGEVRTAWEHSIAPMDRLRYSVTFRTLAGRPGHHG
jgi:alkylated DNA repair dioxygenase AlkB